MKKDKLYVSLEVAKWAFFLLIPIALFIWKCTSIGNVEGGTKFILGCSGYIAILVIYIIFKKAIMKKYLTELNGKIVNYSTQLEVETDEQKITNIEKALRKCLIIRDIFTVAPLVVAAGLILLIVKALEQDVITLYSIMGFVAISYLCGFICDLVQDSNIKSKHRKTQNENQNKEGDE